MSRFQELSKLESDFNAGLVSAEIATKRAGQLVQAFKSDRGAWAKAVILWNRARNEVESNQKTRRLAKK